MRVRIYQPAKTATQSGRAKTQSWLVEPELPTARLPDPLMGWTAAMDTMGELRNKLRFPTRDQAVSFAVQRGWDYTLDEAHMRRVTPRNYLDNFRYLRPQDQDRSRVS